MRLTQLGSGETVVSIVLICFNQGHYLQDAIESALAQTVPGTEIIVVNDGSTDRTADIARAYPQIIYVYQSNQGISAARNSGLRASSGDFVLFLDADDRLLPDAATSSLHCIGQYPESGFVFGRYRKIDGNGVVVSPPNSIAPQSDFYCELLKRNLIGMQSTVMYPRAVIERAGGFDEKLRSCEDYELYLRIAREYPVQKHDGIVAEYRRHSGNMSQNYRSMLKTVLQVLRAQEPYVAADARYAAAVKVGVSNWRDYYGRLMVQDFRDSFRKHGFDRDSIRRFGHLASAYPQGIGQVTKKMLRTMVDR